MAKGDFVAMGQERATPRGNVNDATANKGWLALVALATAQFLMVLDQSVMNVSISALVHDFHTTVTTIQAVITLYCLVMAMLILTGAKIGDMIGRRRAFVIGLIIYACGSALTAPSQSGGPCSPSVGRCLRASARRWSSRRSRP